MQQACNARTAAAERHSAGSQADSGGPSSLPRNPAALAPTTVTVSQPAPADAPKQGGHVPGGDVGEGLPRIEVLASALEEIGRVLLSAGNTQER